MGSGIRRALVVVFAGLIAVAAGNCWQSAANVVFPMPPGPFPLHRAFFVGAWCSPRTSTPDPELWRQFRRSGLDVAVRPLEDTNDRRLNLATLALLDTVSVDHRVFLQPHVLNPIAFVRDNAVHPDESTRPGWRDRVREVVNAYRSHRALGGYFLADEPRAVDFDRVAEVAAEFAEYDSLHPVYVNLLPIPADASVGEQARWRSDAIRLIQKGRLHLFSFDAYSQRETGEDASFLLTLANAARVYRETHCPFVVVLQFTGFATLDPLPLPQLNYLAAEAIAYGAQGIVWFTYSTPNPAEPGMNWRGGAITYDGKATARADTMLMASNRARMLASEFQTGWAAVAHLGGAWPHGSLVSNQRIPGLKSATGGPVTIAAVKTWSPGTWNWLLVNRDRSHAQIIELTPEPTLGAYFLYRFSDPPIGTQGRRLDRQARSIRVPLAPGEAVVVSILTR